MKTVLTHILRKIRNNRSENLEDMAKKLRMSPNFLSRIENMGNWMLYSQLQFIRSSYDLTEEESKELDYAFCHQDEEYVPPEEKNKQVEREIEEQAEREMIKTLLRFI